jgi:hypothetical protein
MPARVQAAPHLGGVLLGAPRTDVDDPRNARSLMQDWRTRAREGRTALPDELTRDPGTRSLAPDGAGHPLVLTEFQSDWQKFATTMRQAGVEP